MSTDQVMSRRSLLKARRWCRRLRSVRCALRPSRAAGRVERLRAPHRRPGRLRSHALLPVPDEQHLVEPGGQRAAAERLLLDQLAAIPGDVPAARRRPGLPQVRLRGRHPRAHQRTTAHRRDAGRRHRRLVLQPGVHVRGPRNYESFHIGQLIPWIDANFRTWAEYNGRAVSGFSMGGFGALKYTAKYYGHFASVSSHSGPASLRRDGGAVVHWAKRELQVRRAQRRHDLRLTVLGPGPGHRRQSGGATRELPQQADLPRHRPRQRRQRELRSRRAERVPRPARPPAGSLTSGTSFPGAHFVRRDMLQRDVDGVVARLRPAG